MIENINCSFKNYNVGAKKAKGKYLFFLNPNTIVFKGAIDVLYHFLEKNKNAGIVAPFLFHEDKKPFHQQGVKELTPFRAIFAISFLNKLFPNNPVAKKYFIQWDKITLKEVDVVPGTAFMISRVLYTAVNGFDEHFFLYFEEFDLCKRVKEKGYQLYIEPKAKIIHLWERSTKKRNDINKIFNESRFYYFKKHYGLLTALFTNSLLNFGKYSFLNLLILFLAAFLLFYKLNEFMSFIGDQGWFYLSARDILLTGKLPLVGITSSHTWLHQGPFWTYLLAFALKIGSFNPVSGAYLTATVGLITVWVIYKIGSIIFSHRVGLLTSLFYATSPLIILNARMSYHTSLIPTFTLIWFYILFQWTKGFKYGFPLLIFLLAILYNFELSMIILIPVLVIVLIYGLVKKEKWVRTIFTRQILILTFIGLIIPMIPMFLFDIHHGYPQTVKFGIWIIYKLANVIHIPLKHPDIQGETFLSMYNFASIRLARLLFFISSFYSWVLLVISLINLGIINKTLIKKGRFLNQYSLLLLLFLIPLIFYIAEKTNSDAYWPVFFPTVAFMFALLFDKLLSINKLKYLFSGLLVIIIGINIWTFLHSEYFDNTRMLSYSNRVEAAKQIINESQGKAYNLRGREKFEQYASFTMNYEYLTWWLGHGPSHIKQQLRFSISEKDAGVIIYKNNSKLNL